MKRIYVKSIMLLVGQVLTVACGKGDADENQDLSADFEDAGISYHDPRLDKPLPKDTLVVGILNTSTSMVIYKGMPLGVEYDLINLFSEQTKTPVKFILESNTFNLVNYLREGKIHLAAGFYHRNIDSSVAHLHFTPALFHNKVVLAANSQAPVVLSLEGLQGKTVYAPAHSRAAQILRSLNRGFAQPMEIALLPDTLHNDEALHLLGEGHMSYLAADEPLVRFFESHYGDVREDVVLTAQDEPIAWLYQDTVESSFIPKLNDWIAKNARSLPFRTVVTNYASPHSRFQKRGNEIMDHLLQRDDIPYKATIQGAAEAIDWPWELIAAQILRESRFNPNLRSSARAVGLMQITPIAAKEVGYPYGRLYEPELNIEAGTRLLKKLDMYWADRIPDSTERLKFVFASYNAGMGHIEDARRLAQKHGKNNQVWDQNVETMTLALSKPAYHRDPVVKYGYCRGKEPVQYVSEILKYYALYTEGTLLGRNAVNSPLQWPWQFRPGQG